MSIYSTNIQSVGLSVRLQKTKELRYLWMLSSLLSILSIFLVHQNQHLGETFTCDECDYKTHTRINLRVSFFLGEGEADMVVFRIMVP